MIISGDCDIHSIGSIPASSRNANVPLAVCIEHHLIETLYGHHHLHLEIILMEDFQNCQISFFDSYINSYFLYYE